MNVETGADARSSRRRRLELLGVLAEHLPAGDQEVRLDHRADSKEVSRSAAAPHFLCSTYIPTKGPACRSSLFVCCKEVRCSWYRRADVLL